MRVLELFAGAGGGILGGKLLGFRTVCAVEIDSFCRAVLLARQKDGTLEGFPIWDDVATFDGRPWRGHVDVVSGGFPCQDISSAGPRTGLVGARSGLWREMARIIGEVEPAFVFIENTPHLRRRGLGTVLRDLAAMGFDAEWGVLGASAVGAPHIRKRLWVVAKHRGVVEGLRAFVPGREIRTASECLRFGLEEGKRLAGVVADPHNEGERSKPIHATVASAPKASGSHGDGARYAPEWWPVDCVSGMDDGASARMDRVKATGNAQVPRVVALAWRILSLRIP